MHSIEPSKRGWHIASLIAVSIAIAGVAGCKQPPAPANTTVPPAAKPPATPNSAGPSNTVVVPSGPGASSSPMPAGANAPSASFHVTACNRSNETLGVAVSYLPVGEPTYWKYVGFYTLNAGACSDLFVTDNETFYMRAEGADGSTWGSDINLCVIHPGPYNFSLKSGDNCPAGGEGVQYSTVTNTTGQNYTWNFNP